MNNLELDAAKTLPVIIVVIIIFSIPMQLSGIAAKHLTKTLHGRKTWSPVDVNCSYSFHYEVHIQFQYQAIIQRPSSPPLRI